MGAERAALDRTGNVFGAVALAVVDRVSDAVATSTDQSESAAVALSALHFLIERPSIDTLRRVLGLSSSGAVRLVDRLVASGYVERREGDDADRVLAECGSLPLAVRIAAARLVNRPGWSVGTGSGTVVG